MTPADSGAGAAIGLREAYFSHPFYGYAQDSDAGAATGYARARAPFLGIVTVSVPPWSSAFRES